jgi:hypothetical protein
MNKNKEQKKKSYRDFQEEFMILLEEGLRSAGRVTKREYDRVSEAVKARLEKKYGKEKVEEFSGRIRTNWQDFAKKFEEARMRVEAEEAFDRGKKIGAQMLEDLGNALKRAARNLEASLSDKVTYHAGQVVDRGVYVCANCSKIQEMKRRRKLAVCPECGSSEMRLA